MVFSQRLGEVRGPEGDDVLNEGRNDGGLEAGDVLGPGAGGGGEGLAGAAAGLGDAAAGVVEPANELLCGGGGEPAAGSEGRAPKPVARATGWVVSRARKSCAVARSFRLFVVGVGRAAAEGWKPLGTFVA